MATEVKNHRKYEKPTFHDAKNWVFKNNDLGFYVPPFRLATADNDDKNSEGYQRQTWDALRKSINGLVNKVDSTNYWYIVPELFSENLVRGMGLLCKSCMKSQMANPSFTNVFAALIAVVNSRFPEIGHLLLRRVLIQLKTAYKAKNKPSQLASVKFVAHLVNQLVAHEIIALQLLAILLETPTEDNVEVAVTFVLECGAALQDLSPRGLDGAFERFRGILHEGEIDKRVQFLIESLFAVRRANFKAYPAIVPELHLVEPEDQVTHEISLLENIDPEANLNIFSPDPNFHENERKYDKLKKSILGDEFFVEEKGSDSVSSEEEQDSESESEEEQMEIRDETGSDLVNFRRTIYQVIMNSLSFEECGHKLLKIIETGQEMELCIMVLECCSQERTYSRFYGLLGQRFCTVSKVYREEFEKCFVMQYSTIHRLETSKMRNVAMFFAHLLGTDAISWSVLAHVRLNEEDTTSSSRIFIKFLFQEVCEHLGLRSLIERLSDPDLQEALESVFPRDDVKNVRFCINFFTSIGLGAIAENSRSYLKNMQKLITQQKKCVSVSESDDESGESVSDRRRQRKRNKKSERKEKSKKACRRH